MYWQCGKPFFSNTPKWRVNLKDKDNEIEEEESVDHS
jgi:hypothetical protein